MATTSKFQALWNHSAGPKIIHFWAPTFKWGFSIANIADFAIPPEKLSNPHKIAVTASGIIWSRDSTVITPTFSPMASAEVEHRCFVGGLAWATDDKSLKRAFSTYGEILDSKIVNDRKTGRSRGFGFVTFASEQAMRNAIDRMNGQNLDGRDIIVNEAPSCGSSGGGGSRGYGGGRSRGGGRWIRWLRWSS